MHFTFTQVATKLIIYHVRVKSKENIIVHDVCALNCNKGECATFIRL